MNQKLIEKGIKSLEARRNLKTRAQDIKYLVEELNALVKESADTFELSTEYVITKIADGTDFMHLTVFISERL